MEMVQKTTSVMPNERKLYVEGVAGGMGMKARWS